MADLVGKTLVPKPGNKNRDWNVGSSANQQSAKWGRCNSALIRGWPIMSGV
jgi:hypothetical protein